MPERTSGRPALRIIDLGFVSEPTIMDIMGFLWQSQGDRRLDSDYAAPEVRSPMSPSVKAVCRPQADSPSWVVQVSPIPMGHDDKFDPLVAIDNEVEVLTRSKPPSAHRGVIRQVGVKDNQLVLVVTWGKSGPPPAGKEVDLRFLKRVGPAADLFSLGLILLGLLTGETHISPIRQAIPMWLAAGVAMKFSSLSSHRQLLSRLCKVPVHTPGIDILRKIAARMESYGKAQRLAEELLGIALRLVLRSQHTNLGAYIPHRAADSRPALHALRRDLAIVRQGLDAVLAQVVSDSEQVKLHQRAEEIRDYLAKMTSIPPPAAGTPPPEFDAARLEHSLRMAATPEAIQLTAVELLHRYAMNRRRLTDHLNQFLMPTEVKTTSNPLVGSAEDQRIIAEVMRLGLPIPADVAVVRRFQ